ncbi:uncharacterized protein LOC114077195 [Solanum pennellii]|uniref:Uncharacterized protein LOC114077195 n=1 Tax=Solanum pennellii TaxID=28526 RepID=A0ABM1VAA7_SOLPN|nr:uncharacterized protein LOC114077195 [Solanum pennellii]
MVERESGCKLKYIRSDNGTEYTSYQFNKYCKDLGIQQQLTGKYTPQWNGVSERKNRIVIKMARCMLAKKKMPKYFWAEAVNTAVYLLNSLATRAVQGITPFEAWKGIKPSARNLKVFGSVCYAHITDVKRGKLDSKSQLCVLLGYSTIAKGYTVYNVSSRKVIVSRDLVVDESRHYDWDRDSIVKNQDSPVLKNKSLAEVYEQCHFSLIEPSSFEEAANHKMWISAMEEELSMINKHGWELVDRPEEKNVVGVKWVYRTKYNPDGSIFKNKARHVVKVILSRLEWILEKREEDKVYKLKRALYGLKEAPRAWFSSLDSHLLSQRFNRSLNKPTLYFKGQQFFSEHKEARYCSTIFSRSRVCVCCICYKSSNLVKKDLVGIKFVAKTTNSDLCDNKSAIMMAENPGKHGRTKNINIRFHALRDAEKNGEVKLVHYISDQQTDVLTKALSTKKFKFQRQAENDGEVQLAHCSSDQQIA